MIRSIIANQNRRVGAWRRTLAGAVVSTCAVGAMAVMSPFAAATTEQDESIAAAAAAASLPFNYTVNFDSNLRGRDMKTPSGNFCNRYRSDFVANPAATPYITITLIHNRTAVPDERLESHRFPNDGQRHSFCWPHHDGSHTYHFEYSLPNFGYTVKGHGTVYRR